ncbi:hypothetical protein Q5H93_21690 [Hymenobacter sp. ASUV-10]|uniref:ArsR family transcriptional regulator n=1 Tax=Hymenobacter aranciens TaxID=3063996 RepID=A0ABT9BGI2_9BACT|nr:hypothetical protein [Hymenobacter sp. ASUV-10]MDO7877369.1 hypothetical protein [Hymenobacter sp. ASUV-10]
MPDCTMPSNPNTERQDSKRNRKVIRKHMLAFIKDELRAPTVQELVELTGFSDKTISKHLERITLGDGSANPFQALTSDVLLKLYERATGYSHPAVKILAVSQGKGEPSVVERHEYTEHYPPDPTAVKLWMALVEGITDKAEVKHSGEIATQAPPAIIQVIRHRPTDDKPE